MGFLFDIKPIEHLRKNYFFYKQTTTKLPFAQFCKMCFENVSYFQNWSKFYQVLYGRVILFTQLPIVCLVFIVCECNNNVAGKYGLDSETVKRLKKN